MLGKPIDMIVFVDQEGNMRPIRFRMKSKNGENVVIAIKNAMIKESRTFGQNRAIRYKCQSVVNNALVNYEITFETKTMMWSLHAT